MSLLTKVFTAAFYSFCLALWLMAMSEVFRMPIGEPSITESRDLSDSVKKRSKEDSTFFKKLPGTNWTLFDIRFGDILGRKQIVGVPGELNLPEGAEGEVDLMEEELQGGLGNKRTSGNFGRRNRSSGNHVLVYNRVPKCASETMLSIIR